MFSKSVGFERLHELALEIDWFVVRSTRRRFTPSPLPHHHNLSPDSHLFLTEVLYSWR
ncbi:unnamed protein product [Rhodiola kirilowii]